VRRLLNADPLFLVAASEVLARIVECGLRSPSRELDREARRVLESRLDHDFDRVRVHTEPLAAASAAALGAVAYTSGDHIVFAQDQYAPSTGTGLTLIAHELVHVIQQGGPSGGPERPVEIGERSDPMEHEADAVARSVADARAQASADAGEIATHSGEPAPPVQREAGKEEGRFAGKGIIS